ncbi:hypothetical protein pipiens_002856 [Culex pipiens pipiens]|uniref:Uncharacterized protein n=1 Tax=Culex pipiens pipiens TaxID=38569 RepID=A0ABD1DA69_CULPP
MLQVAVRILAVATLVNAVVVLNGAGDPEINLSSGSAEAEIFLSHDEDGVPVVSKKKLETPQDGKKMYMIKRLNSMGVSTVKPTDTKKPWRNLFDRISEVSEEHGHMNPPLRIIVNDDVEQSEELKDKKEVKSIREQMEIAQRKELNELVEQLTFQTWKSEDFNGSEQKFIDWMLTVPIHARKPSESEEESVQRLLQKRSSYCSCCNQNERPSCQPCVVNIFNNSHIGCVVVGSDSKLPCAGCSHKPGDFSIVLPSTSEVCGQPNAFNVEYIPNCECPPVVTECATTTTTTTTECPTSTTEASCEDPYVRYETSTPAPYNCKCSTTSPHQPPPCHHEQSPHPRPIYPWYNYPEPEYRPKTVGYGPASVEDQYDPYKNFPFDIPSAEIEDCSREELDYSSNYHVKRDPQYMDKDWIYQPPAQKTTKYPSPKPAAQADDEESVRLIIDLPPTFQSQEVRQDSNLRNTLAKIGLSLNSERPAAAKALGSSQYNRKDRT